MVRAGRRAVFLLLAVVVAAAGPAPVRAGAADDLHQLVRKWRSSGEETGGALAGWPLERARSAVQGAARQRKPPAAWTDPEVLAAAMFMTATAQRELVAGSLSYPQWFDLARQLLDGVADAASRRSLQRDWILAVAALHRSRFAGLDTRAVLDRGVELQPQEPELLLAAARIHEAIAERSFTGLAEPVSAPAGTAAQVDLLAALQLYQRLRQAVPDRPDARLRCCRVLCLLRRTGEARELLEPLRQLPTTTDLPCLAWLFLGVAHELDGHPARALACYRGALGTGRAPQSARLAIARLLAHAGDTAGARRVVDEMLADATAEDAWARHQAEGFGEDSDHAARLAALWKAARQ